MGSANALVPISLAAFAPVVLVLMRQLGATRGVLAALLGGWLFLPVFDHQLDVPLLGTKLGLVPTAVLLVSVAVDGRRWLRLRWHWLDLAALALIVGPFLSALANDLGPYEGASALFDAFCSWGAPYLLGRCYLGHPRAAREYALWLVGAGLVYVPLCLWEVRMSPQLHRLVYGFRATGSFGMAVRYGGYRPDVFMAHGLAVGMFMACTALVAYTLWRARAADRLLGLPMGWCVLLLAATTVLVKSTGAIILLAVGVATVEATRRLRSPVPILLLALFAPAFCAARISGWTGSEVVRAAEGIAPDRAYSLLYRIENEQVLLDKALQRPVLGWGRWGRSRVRDATGRDLAVTDSLWIITLGTGGLVGLLSVGTLMLLPALLLLKRFRGVRWHHPRAAAVAALAIASVLWVLDSLFNAMMAPIYTAMVGATVALLAGREAGRQGPGRQRRSTAPSSTPAPSGRACPE
jgi:O-antigen ligase